VRGCLRRGKTLLLFKGSLVKVVTPPVLVSVYMPTKNRLEMLKRAVSSVMTQSYKNLELIIVDDGSTDGTLEYLETLAEEHENVSIFKNTSSKGACFCRNLAIREAKGYFVTGIDDDDEFLSDRLEILVSAYKPQYAYVCAGIFWDYGDYRKAIGNSQMQIRYQDILSKDHAFNQVLVEKSRIVAAGLFDEALPAVQDWDMWTRLNQMFGDALRVAECLYIVHVGHDAPRISTSGKKFQGYSKYFDKHQHDMSEINFRDHKFLQTRALRQFPSIANVTKNNKNEYFRYVLSYFFPWLTMLRLRILKGKK
jgi:glycosyltransferase involved in cell wall biosynthesis